VEIVLGFVIALAIALTGVGAGSLTTPLLLMLTSVSPAEGVGTALAFGFLVKCISTPVYLFRGQVNFRVLRYLLYGGVPGVVIGSFLLNHLQGAARPNVINILLGIIIAATAIFHLWRMFQPRPDSSNRDRAHYLPYFAFLIGLEVGFSSAGAGALGSLLLLGMTTLSAAEVVGTDLCFGLVIALVGSGFEFSVGNYDAHLLILLVTGGIAGSIVGTLLTGRIAQRPLRIGLLILLVILGGQLCYRGLDLKLLNSATASSKALTLHAETARPRPPLGSPATSASLQ
jgi:uncharacterized membrane protein YfcA